MQPPLVGKIINCSWNGNMAYKIHGGKRVCAEKKSEEIMADNLLSLMKDINPQIQKLKQTSNNINLKKSMPRYHNKTADT